VAVTATLEGAWPLEVLRTRAEPNHGRPIAAHGSRSLPGSTSQTLPASSHLTDEQAFDLYG